VGAEIPDVSFELPRLAGSHTSGYSFLVALRPCPDRAIYNIVVEMIDRQIFLTVWMQN